jgi:isopenicillin N synthase-like dioxygenase
MHPRITIGIIDGKVSVDFTGLDTPQDVISAMYTALLATAKDTVSRAEDWNARAKHINASPNVEQHGYCPEYNIKTIKEDLYDALNAGASHILELFAPEIELRPDITVEALARMEREIMKEVVESLEEDANQMTFDDLNKVVH